MTPLAAFFAFVGGVVVVAGLIVMPLIITVVVGFDATPANRCWAAGQAPDAGITLIGRCAREAGRE